jgi:hypothetical protein
MNLVCGSVTVFIDITVIKINTQTSCALFVKIKYFVEEIYN